LAFGVSSAKAEGNLYIYNWTDYTSPKLVEKFEAETGIKVTVDTYDSNETLLAKLQSGATGYDLAIPSQHFVEIMIAEDLLVAVDVKGMSNYANVDERWRNPPWDPEQKYSVPWNMGNASFAYRVDLYSGDGSSFKEFFEPNEEVSGRLGVFKAPDEVINMANLYLGIPYCSEDPAEMKRVQDLLMNQKPHVAMYSSEGQNDRLANGEVIMHAHWDGYSMKGRQDGADIAYAFPKEGVVGWFDSLVVPRGAKNVENAEKFMNFLMAPENAALQSNFARYANAIVGSLEYMDEDLKAAPEMNPPQDVPVVFGKACPPKAQKLIDKVWTRLLQ
jgi:spermidine/putrescine transport system substrate-binding protein